MGGLQRRIGVYHDLDLAGPIDRLHTKKRYRAGFLLEFLNCPAYKTRMYSVPPPAADPLRVCSLFSGIGGFEVGLEAAGHEIALMCELDPFARSVLEDHFGKTELASDVVKLTKLPECDLLVAGWPCQDLSLAGETRGLDGDRSGLVNEVLRLLESPRRPRYVLLENVSFALDLHAGRAVRHVVARLQQLGYRWAYRLLDTRMFGIPQRRRRLFILASLDRDPAEILMDGVDKGPVSEDDNPSLVGFYWTEGNRGTGWSPEAVPPLKGGSGLGIPSPPAIWDRATGAFMAPGIEDAERLQGFSAGWTSAAAALPKGQRRRWTLVGNAVSVPVAKWLGRRLADPTASTDLSTFAEAEFGIRLPRAASGGPGLTPRAYAVAREGSSTDAVTSLTSFGLKQPVLMSIKAIRGFARRYESAPLKKDPAFLDALRAWTADTLAT